MNETSPQARWDGWALTLAGCCAQGGLATFLHCDHWAAAIAKATTVRRRHSPPSRPTRAHSCMVRRAVFTWQAQIGAAAKVACMPDSGFFLDEERSPVREKLTEKHIVLCIAWPCRPI